MVIFFLCVYYSGSFDVLNVTCRDCKDSNSTWQLDSKTTTTASIFFLDTRQQKHLCH